MPKKTTDMEKDYMRHIIQIIKLTILCCLFVSCLGGGQHKGDVVFTEEQKISMEKKLKSLPTSQLEMIANVTSKKVSDTLFLQSMIANRLMSTRMRREANFQRAIEYGQQSYEKAVQIEDTIEIVRMLNELGTNFRRIGAFTDALEYHYKALAIAECYSDTIDRKNKSNLTYAYNGIGNIALSMHNNAEAKRCFQLGLKLEEELESRVGLAINYANLGSIMQSECKYDSALYYYEQSYAMNRLCGSVLGQALCQNHFGSLFEAQELLDSARVRYLRGYTMLTSSSDKWHWLVSCVSLGRVFLKMGRLKEAEEYLLNARDIALNADATESLEEAHALLAELYKKKGEYQKALTEVSKSQELNEAIRKEMQTNTFNNAQLRFIREKETLEVEMLNERREFEREQARAWNILAIVVFVILLILMLQMFFTIKIVRKRNRAMKKMQEEKNSVFEVISSEMKTPAIEQRNTLQYIVDNQEELSKQELREYLIQACSSAVKQVDQLTNLLTWSHIKMGETKPKFASVNICQVVTEAIDMLNLSARQKNISYALPYDNGLMVRADSEMLMCIVLNLISNAIKFSYSGGEIAIKYKEDAFSIMLYVEDHGVGIEEKQLAQILNAEQVEKNINFDKEISGLGLKISVILAKKNNGTLTGESRLHRGTVFVLKLQKSGGQVVKQ